MLACHAGGRGFESRPLRHPIRRTPQQCGVRFFMRAARGCVAGSASARCHDGHRVAVDPCRVGPWTCPGCRPDGGLGACSARFDAKRLDCTATSRLRLPMLQTLREKMSGWIAIVIVVLLAIPFAFFGMEQYLFQSGANYAAKVEVQPAWWRSAPDLWPVRKLAWKSAEITPEEFREAFENERQRRRQVEGEQFDARAFETPESKREVLETLIDRKVMQLAAQRDGMVVGDSRVRETINEIPAFQVDGVFDEQRYVITLQSQGYTPQGFQELIRDDLQASLLAGQVARSAFTTPGETERMMRLLGERRDVALVVLPAPEPDTGAVSAEEIQAWFEANRAGYRAPERVAIEYVEIDASALPPVAEPDEATLRQRYEQEKARFVEPEQR